MLSNFGNALRNIVKCGNLLGTTTNHLQQQVRTTFILKRRFPLRLHKQGEPQKAPRKRNFIYDYVKNTDHDVKPELSVILTEYVEGLGQVGDQITLRQHYVYNHLLLQGLAVYATPENIAKYKTADASNEEIQHSSPFAVKTAKCLSNMLVSVVMNKDKPWTIEPWHIRISLRKCGFTVPDKAIKLPENEISGPNMDLENKEFYVTITINNMETSQVRCVIHHWSTDMTNRLQHVHCFWKQSQGAVFAEDQAILDSMPPKIEKTKKLRDQAAELVAQRYFKRRAHKRTLPLR